MQRSPTNRCAGKLKINDKWQMGTHVCPFAICTQGLSPSFAYAKYDHDRYSVTVMIAK